MSRRATIGGAAALAPGAFRSGAALLLSVALAVVIVGGASARAQDQEIAPGEAIPSRASRELPRVVGIEVVGARRYTEEQLRDALGQPVGEALDPGRVERGLANLWRALRVRATVLYQEVEGGLVLRLSVVEMPVDLEPRFLGNDAIDEATLRKWAQLGDRSELYLYQTARVRQRLLEGYRREGYAFAEVEPVVRGGEAARDDPDAPLPDVIFEIREGPQVRVKGVEIRGNDSMPDRGMWWWRDGIFALSKADLSGPWLFNWKGDKFIRETLESDLIAMREVYRDRGWLDAVVELERLEFSDDRSGVTIHIVVDEGRPYRVSKLEIRAVKLDATGAEEPAELLFPEEELLPLCKLAPGRRYELARQRSDEAALRNHYGKRGYLSHASLRGLDPFEFLEPELLFDYEHREVAVTYRLSQGRKRMIREVLFEGAEHTRDRVLRREVRVLPGETADLEAIQRSLRRLTDSGYFSGSQLDLDHRDPTFRFLPVEGDPDRIDLQYIVEEGTVVDFNIQGGVDTNSGLFARTQLGMRNFDVTNLPDSLWSTFGDVFDRRAFRGAGQQLDIDVTLGTEYRDYGIHFLEPDLFRSHFDRVSLDLRAAQRLQRFRAYDEERTTRQVRLGREFGPDFAVFLGFTDQDLFVDDIDAPLSGIDDPLGTPIPGGIYEQEGASDLIGTSLDFRYRRVDTILNTRQGFDARWSNDLYGGALGGDYQFVKSSLDLDWYWKTGAEDEEARPGFHLGVALGLADAFGESSETPYTERFFLGGSRRMRGFSFRGVGPTIGGEPIGGETMLFGTLEYRMPLYSVVQPGTYREQEIFRLTLFTDAGLLDPDPWTADLDELRATYGFSLGMSYPIPINLNFGWPLLSEEGDREQVFSLTISNLRF